ncbi:DUF2971 domain-containing protein [Leeia oryzae]|uniref:DUF2971 domain-containing protein n=1 Tax=Leeia oryzae TaxID=356662 RepID=UPI00037AC058|nr:DUF2971 domain-containing protein [Leeia oryzae]
MKLYRFQPLPTTEDNRLASLTVNEIWASDPSKFNDPFDTKPSITNRLPDEWIGWEKEPALSPALRNALAGFLSQPEIFKAAPLIDDGLLKVFGKWVNARPELQLDEESQDRDEIIQAAIKQRISQFGVTCLTRQLSNRLMWAHYATQGQGYCLEYELDTTIAVPDILFTPVQYSSAIPHYCISEAMFTPHQFLPRVMATKHADWAYENEYRLVFLKGKGNAMNVSDEYIKLTGLIAGYAMPEPWKTYLYSTAAKLGISSSEMKTDESGRLIRKSDEEWA